MLWQRILLLGACKYAYLWFGLFVVYIVEYLLSICN